MTEMTAPKTAPRLEMDEDNVTQWARENGKKVGIAAGVIVLLAVGIWGYQSSARNKEAAAQQELMQARASAEAGNMPLAASDLSKLIERFSGTKAADEASILLNQVRLVQGQRTVAINALQTFVRSHHEDYILSSAYGLLGGGLEDEGKYKDAAQSYRLASDNAPLDFLKAQFLIDAGRAFAAAHDTASAKKAYGDLLEKYPRIDQAGEARVRMGEIGGTVPPPPPPVDSTN